MNLDSALRVHLEGCASLRNRALELITILNNVPMAKMTRAQLKNLELLEQKAKIPVDYYNYQRGLGITKSEVQELENMTHLLTHPAN